MALHFVAHADINFSLWDDGMARCYNENPYSYSAWLNLVCPAWGALIDANYSVLIPLPIKKKLGISYVSQPLFTQQLGVFTEASVDRTFLEEALLQIPKRFLKTHLQLNVENYIPALPLQHKITHWLSLHRPYEELYAHFTTHHKRNINRAIEISNEERITITASKDIALFIQLFKQTAGIKDASLGKKEYDLIQHIMHLEQGQILFCCTPEGEVLAGLFYLKSRTKIVNLFNFITPNGKEKKAMYLLLNHWIKSFSNQPVTLDFEGSMVASIARFYVGFGATPKNYQLFTKNKFW